jgi:hypothetical protein
VMHRVQDSALDGLETIAHIGQCARSDHTERVDEVLLLRLFGEGCVQDGRRGLIVATPSTARPPPTPTGVNWERKLGIARHPGFSCSRLRGVPYRAPGTSGVYSRSVTADPRPLPAAGRLVKNAAVRPLCGSARSMQEDAGASRDARENQPWTSRNQRRHQLEGRNCTAAGPCPLAGCGILVICSGRFRRWNAALGP